MEFMIACFFCAVCINENRRAMLNVILKDSDST